MNGPVILRREDCDRVARGRADRPCRGRVGPCTVGHRDRGPRRVKWPCHRRQRRRHVAR